MTAMAVNIGITALLIIISMIFVNELTMFWGDRTTLGNAIYLCGVGFFLVWVGSAIWQVWR
jgi:hypothetical protein